GGAWGAGGLIGGWRGRRVGSHPHCRKCGFDLFGSGEDAASCPECGQVLRRDGEPIARARMMGQRRRRWWAMVPGVLALMIAAGGASMWHGPSKATLYGWAPSAALMWVVEDELARMS
ncbi:MAG: zinc ribbon domain-containing protein, partial [Phycisphaeraceae bacterium]